MQWAIDVITLSNTRRWGNQELFEGKRESCIKRSRTSNDTASRQAT